MLLNSLTGQDLKVKLEEDGYSLPENVTKLHYQLDD